MSGNILRRITRSYGVPRYVLREVNEIVNNRYGSIDLSTIDWLYLYLIPKDHQLVLRSRHHIGIACLVVFVK